MIFTTQDYYIIGGCAIFILFSLFFMLSMRRLNKGLKAIQFAQLGLTPNGKKLLASKDHIEKYLPKKNRSENKIHKRIDLFLAWFMSYEIRIPVEAYIKHYYSPEREFIYNGVVKIAELKAQIYGEEEKIKKVEKLPETKFNKQQIKIFKYEDKHLPESEI
jgi:hypothetical protein